MLGESLALGCAFTWSASVILFKRSEDIPPQGLNLFKNVVAELLLLGTLPLLGVGIDWGRPAGDWIRLLASGVLGIGLADTLFFVALRRLGPGQVAVVECCYSPCLVVLAVLVLGETPRGGFLVGAPLVVLGILVVTTDRGAVPERLRPGTASRPLAVMVGIVAMVSMAVGVVIVKPVLERSSLLEVVLIRLSAGIAAQLAWILPWPERRALLRVLRPDPVWRTLLPASFLGSYVSLLLWMGGFKWASASRASILNQMSTVFTLALARVLLREPVSPRRAAGAAVAVGGALLVLLG